MKSEPRHQSQKSRATFMALVLGLSAIWTVAGPVEMSLSAERDDLSICQGSNLVATHQDPGGSDPCPGIRPGAWISSSVGRCTINFIFSDKRSMFAGTAGHCVKRVGEKISATAPDITIGRVALRINRGYYRDFALIAIKRKLWSRVDPKACAWGGPVGLAVGTQDDLAEVRHMGYGYGLGYVPGTESGQPATYARRGVAPRLSDPEKIHFLGVVSPGDSGSGAYLKDGRALGVITVLEASLSSSEGVRGTVGGGRLDFLLELASKRMRRPIHLVNADGTLVTPKPRNVQEVGTQ